MSKEYVRYLIIFFSVLFLVLYYFFFLREEEEDEDDYPVDIVYLWVAEEDPEREIYKKLEGIQQNDGNSCENRYNNHEELRYSLRGLDMYCPWVNNIFVFVKDGQCPSYLNLNNPKIHLVYHSQVIPKEYLPLFNTNPIEQHIHNIPGLADHYVYFNDDLMVNKPTKKSDFFKNGIPVVNYREGVLTNFDSMPSLPYNHPFLLWYNYRVAQKLFNIQFSCVQLHTPSPCFKPWEKELDQLIKDNGYWNIRKFRTNRDIVLNNYLRNIFYVQKGSPKVNWGESYISFEMQNSCKPWHEYKNRRFLCINEISNGCKDKFLEYVTDRFPYQSQYEWD